jgi:pimeloyl-ACP methyl ester carboxylesterase
MPDVLTTSNRPTLILLSGLLCDEEIWRDVRVNVASLVNVEVFSFAGFSSITDMALHVLHTAPPRFAICGHSMGGRVALEVVRLVPNRVIGLALLNTGVHPVAPHEPHSRGELVALAKKDGMSALAARWLPPMLGRPRACDDQLVVRLTQMIERATPDCFEAQVNALLRRPPADSVLRSVGVPVLLLSATADTWSPPGQHAAMQKLCPAAKLVVIEDAGHMAPVEQPEKTAAALKEWINRVNDVTSPHHG